MIPKNSLENLVIDQLKSRILTRDNMEKLAVLVNEEMHVSGDCLQGRLDVIDAEVADLNARLQRLYDTLETEKIALEDLAPRIRELRTRESELQGVRVQTEAEMTAEVGRVDSEQVATYAQDMAGLLRGSDLMESKRFIRSFVKRISVGSKSGSIEYSLPMPPEYRSKERLGVLPTVTFGGGEGSRTPDPLLAKQVLSH